MFSNSISLVMVTGFTCLLQKNKFKKISLSLQLGFFQTLAWLDSVGMSAQWQGFAVSL